MIATQLAQRWRFGRVEFDDTSLELSVDGVIVEIDRKPLEVLRALLRQAGKVVMKDALVQAAWPGRIVTDAALAKSIARLRDAIGDSEHALIRTHHGYGYRLIAEVVTENAPATFDPPPTAAASLADPTPILRADAEHRVLTILFCDLVDSTALAESLDPESFRELLLGYQRAAAQIGRRYEGYLAQQFGDGLMFYFGYPTAHDDDPERALRCACDLLAVLTRSPALAPLKRAAALSLRIGVHTGAVVIGHVGSGGEPLATGSSVHLASRLQALAEPNTILVSDASYRLVPGLFVTRDFGPQTVRGMNEPVRVHQVIQPSGMRSRLEAAARLTPFVGREREIEMVTQCWREAIEGSGQAILFTGEPGLGKSRLLMELRARLADTAHTWLECRADALNRHSAFHVMSGLLQRCLALQDADDDAQKLQRLEQGLDAVALNREEAIPHLAPLLDITLPDRYPPLPLAPELKRKRTLEIFSDWIARLAYQQPLVIAFEDLHWIDGSSLEFNGELLNRIASLPVLLVMTARPEFKPPWPIRSPLHSCGIEALNLSQVGQMLSGMIDGADLAPGLTQLIFERASGVPLFVEELTRSLLESGQIIEHQGQLEARVPLGALSIPGNLHGLLQARLDRLGAARELIQIAAVIGREVPHRLLQVVAGLDKESLSRQVDRLIESGLMYAQGTPPKASYIFKHALIGDSAYGTLLKSAREKLHGAVAQALETYFPERTDEQPEVVAAHYEKAGLIESAVRWYKVAAEKTLAVLSFTHVVAHCDHALRLLNQLPKSSQRDHLEADLSLTLGSSLTMTLGYAHEEPERVLTRAQELSEKAGDPLLQGRALANLWLVRYGGCGDYRQALELTGQLVSLGTATHDRAMLCTGLAERAWTLVSFGRLAEAIQCGRHALSLLDPQVNASMTRIFGRDGYHPALAPVAYAEMLLGSPDQALVTGQSLFERATKGNRPIDSTWTLIRPLACLWLLRREPQRVLEWIPAAIEFGDRYGYLDWAIRARLYLGLAYCMLDRQDQGLPLVRTANAAWSESQTVLHSSLHAALEAEQYRRFDLRVEAQKTLDRGFAHVERTGERFVEAELHRVQGELLLHPELPRLGEAEARFRRALEVSREQGARLLELRAASSLARLWQIQGRKREAIDLLKPIYDGFTEGFDTPDLRDAAKLLAALS